MDIIRVITDLLISAEKVTVPGLGVFSLNYHPAEIYKFTNRVTPPSRQIQFSETFDVDDHKLLFVLSQEYDTAYDLAKETVEKFVESIFITLNNGNSYSIEGLGILRKVEDKIHFEADKNSILFAENYGLETTQIPLFEIEKENPVATSPKPVIPAKTKKSNVLNRVVSIIAILVICMTGFVLYQMGYIDMVITKAENFITAQKKAYHRQLATNDTLKGKMDADSLKRKALIYKEKTPQAVDTTSQNSNVKKVLKYYLIAGSFRNEASAEKHQKEFIEKGFKPEILSVGDSIFRISIISYTNRQKAVDEYIKLTSGESNFKLWLFSQMVSE